MTASGSPHAGSRPQARAAPDLSSALIGSAPNYLARSAGLLQAALTAEPEAAAGLEAEAGEWRRLAITADWQEAMGVALAAVDAAPASYESVDTGLAEREVEVR